MFGQHDQGRARLIQARVHPGSDLHSAREREADVHAVAHLIRGERALDLVDDLFARWKIDKRQRARRALQPIEMFVQLEDAAVVKPQSFPDGVAALHRRIERTDPGFIAMHETAVDVYDQVAVLLVKLLEHEISLSTDYTMNADYSDVISAKGNSEDSICANRRNLWKELFSAAGLG